MIGFLGGFLGGLLGVGGGFVMIPLLVLWAKIDQRHANATSLVAIMVGLAAARSGRRPQAGVRDRLPWLDNRGVVLALTPGAPARSGP